MITNELEYFTAREAIVLDCWNLSSVVKLKLKAVMNFLVTAVLNLSKGILSLRTSREIYTLVDLKTKERFFRL